MLKKRIIFTLIYEDGHFMLSRNFRLQRVGNLKWLEKNYNFIETAKSIDELIILDASRTEKNLEKFCTIVSSLTENVFIPVSLGGGIKSHNEAQKYMHAGADKLVINSSLINDPLLIRGLIEKYGAQCIIASVDFKFINNRFVVFIQNGEAPIHLELEEYLVYLTNLGVGEIYLNSIDKDGTGQGYELILLNNILLTQKLPVIIAGGAGNYSHLLEGLNHTAIDAVATANLFNFVGDGLRKAREELINKNVQLPNW